MSDYGRVFFYIGLPVFPFQKFRLICPPVSSYSVFCNGLFANVCTYLGDQRWWAFDLQVAGHCALYCFVAIQFMLSCTAGSINWLTDWLAIGRRSGEVVDYVNWSPENYSRRTVHREQLAVDHLDSLTGHTDASDITQYSNDTRLRWCPV